jgi:hypothetical protein
MHLLLTTSLGPLGHFYLVRGAGKRKKKATKAAIRQKKPSFMSQKRKQKQKKTCIRN